jgi:hypothetical protein
MFIQAESWNASQCPTVEDKVEEADSQQLPHQYPPSKQGSSLKKKRLFGSSKYFGGLKKMSYTAAAEPPKSKKTASRRLIQNVFTGLGLGQHPLFNLTPTSFFQPSTSSAATASTDHEGVTDEQPKLAGGFGTGRRSRAR